MNGVLSPGEIADRIKDAREFFIGASLYLFLLNRDDTYGLMKNTLFPANEQHHIKFAREGRPAPYEVINYGPILEGLRGNQAFALAYYRQLLQAPVIQIGDNLAKNRYFSRSPELEFYRHVRNALGHGNRFSFTRNEPRRPATFQGRAITRSLDGQYCFFSFMGPGDVLELWEWLEGYLRALPNSDRAQVR